MSSRRSEESAEYHDLNLVRRLIRTMPKRHLVRRCAEAILAGEAMPQDKIPALCRAFREKDKLGILRHERVVACWCLDRCGDVSDYREQVCVGLRAALAGSLIPISRSSREYAVVLLMNLCIFAWLIFFAVTTSIGLTVYMGGILAFIIATLARRTHAEAQGSVLGHRSAIRCLARLGDYRAVGEVAKATTDKNAEIRGEAEKALPELLEAVRKEHYGLLPPEATPALCEALIHWQSGVPLTDVDHGRHTKLRLEILGALGRAGDGRAAETVRRLAEGSQSESIRRAAMEVLPILDQRLRNETASSRLLRPSSTPSDPAQVLLRPAGSATAVPEEQLLRPAESEVTAMVETDQ